MPPIALLNLAAIGIVLLIAGFMMMRRAGSRNMEGLFFTAILLFVLLFVDDLALTIVAHAASVRYDEYVFCFDRLFGSPSFVIGRLFEAYGWFRNLSLYAYVLAPSVCLAVVTIHFFLRPLQDAVRCVRTIVIGGLLAYPFFLIFPVAGPRYAFPTFPFSPPVHLVPHPILLQAVPNAVPSVHMTLALFVLWFLRPWKTAGWVLGSSFVLLTVASTLGSGEHYLLDLIAAVPYSALVIYLGGYSVSKNTAATTEAKTVEFSAHASSLE